MMLLNVFKQTTYVVLSGVVAFFMTGALAEPQSKTQPKMAIEPVSNQALGTWMHDAQLHHLISMALTQNPSLQAEATKWQAAKSVQKEADSLTKPNVTFQSELSYAWMEKHQFPRTANQLKATYPLYQPDKTDSQAVAKYRQSASELGVEALRQTLIKEVAQTYYEYWAQKAQWTYLEKERTSIQAIEKQVQSRFEVGYQALDDIAEIQAQLAENHAQRLQVEERLAVIQSQLEALVGQSIMPSDWTRPRYVTSGNKQINTSKPDFAAQISAHPEVAQLLQSAQAEQRQIQLEKHKDGPQIEAFGAYVYNESDGYFYDDMQGVRGGIQLNVPLYLAGRTDARVATVRAKQQQLQAQARQAELSLQAQAESGWLKYQAGMAQLTALETVLKASQQALGATQNALETGQRNVLDLLNAQRRLHRAQRDLPVTQAKIRQAWYQWQWAIGRL